ncbi:MAG: hypothetical protein KGQ57_00020 [Burkholderiales bacterium]|nr:hypothetical protein [Burkholderiales bacterium]
MPTSERGALTEFATTYDAAVTADVQNRYRAALRRKQATAAAASEPRGREKARSALDRTRAMTPAPADTHQARRFRRVFFTQFCRDAPSSMLIIGIISIAFNP